VVATALFVGTPGAGATQAQPVLAGAQNDETSETLISNTDYVSLQACLNVSHDVESGLVACGLHGLQGLGTAGYGVYGKGAEGVSGDGSRVGVSGSGPVAGVSGSVNGSAGDGNGVQGFSYVGNGVLGKASGPTGNGVHGQTSGTGPGVFGEATGSGIGVFGMSAKYTAIKGIGGPTGIEGQADDGGTGVYGHNEGFTGIGVHGETGGTGSAVFGEATASGVGVFAKSQTGTALRGDSPSGTALQVNGKAKFSRSGTVTIASGTASKTVSLSGVTGSSMVVATAQQNGSVFVKAAVPASGSFTIYLTGNATGSGLKVAYFVLN